MNFAVKFIFVHRIAYVNGIITREAAVTETETFVVKQAAERRNGHICKRIRSYVLSNFGCGPAIMSDEPVLGIYIRSEVATVYKRRRRNSYVNLFCSCFAEQPHYSRAGSTSDD